MVFNSQWFETNKFMSDTSPTDSTNARFFESLFLSWKNSLIVPEWVRVWQSSWCHLRIYLSSTKFGVLISWSPVCTPLIGFHYHWKVWVMTLVANTTTYRNTKGGKSCKITNITVKESERRPFIFIFRLNNSLRDSYEADEIVMEIEEWKQKVPDIYVKSFIRVLLGVLEASIVS